MADLTLSWGGDIATGPTGDLATVTGSQLGQQRLIRRLLTNSGDYIWQPGYGAGLAGFVGSPVDADRIHAVILSQLFKEAAVAATPAPVVTVDTDQGGAFNTITATVLYTDALTDQVQNVHLTIGG
jgi:hypothetical protein